MSKRICESSINKTSKNLKISDTVSEIIDRNNPFSEINMELIFNSHSVQKNFFESLFYAFKENIKIDLSIFKIFLQDKRLFNEQHFYTEKNIKSFRIFLKECQYINIFFKDIHKILDKDHEDYYWAILYICNILNNLSPQERKLYTTTYYSDVDELCQKKEMHNILEKINLDLIYPFLYFYYFFKNNNDISVFGLYLLEENDYRLLCLKFGEKFIVKSIPIILKNYLKTINKWMWKPQITNKIKNKLINRISSIEDISMYTKSEIITLKDAINIMELGICKLEDSIEEYKYFIDIFENNSTVYGKCARFFRDKPHYDYYDIFLNDSDFSKNEKICIIKNIIPINYKFFEKIENFNLFKLGIDFLIWYDFIDVLFLIDKNYCSKLDVTLIEMRDFIHEFLSRKPNNVDIFYNLYPLEISFDLIFVLSSFIADNKNYCLTRGIFFKWFLKSCAILGKDIYFEDDDLFFLNKLGDNFNIIISSVINEFRHKGKYFFLTNRIYWKIDNNIVSMIPDKIYPVMDDELFIGINKSWNKLNTILFNIKDRSPDHIYIINIANVINNICIENEDNIHLIPYLFNLIDIFHRESINKLLTMDLLKFITIDKTEILFKNQSTFFLVKSIYSIFVQKKINNRILWNSKNRFFIEKTNFLTIKKEEEEKEKLKDCDICYDKKKYFIKLNCKCNFNFCLSCIFEMRHKAIDNKISCPTCRKISCYHSDTIILNH